MDFSVSKVKMPQKTRNQMLHKMTNNTTLQLDDEITKTEKEKLDICENHLFRLKKIGKKM